LKNILALDASSENISLYLKKGEKEPFDFNSRIKFGASKLPGIVDKALRKLDLDLRDVDTFLIGSGPGSFTGLRVSFSLFKAFMVSLGKPVYSVGSFFSCAYPYRNKHENIAVVSDARKNLIYLAGFKSKNGILRKIKKERLVSIEELVKEKKDYFFVSYDLHLREKILRFAPQVKFSPKAVYPKAKYLIEAVKMLNISEFSRVDKLIPLYLHPKICQIKKF